MSEGHVPNIVGFKQPADFYYRTAQRALQAEDLPNAVSNARTAVRLKPDSAAYRLLLADTLSEVHKYDESTRILLSLLEGNAGVDAECLYLLGTNFMSSNDYEKAQECFGEYLSILPDGSHVGEIEEYMAFMGSQHDDSVYYFEDVNAQEAHRKATQAKMYLESGQYKRAIQMIESIPAGQASVPHVRNNLALAYFCDGEQEQALEITRELLIRDPNNVHANCNMATFLKEMGHSEEAGLFIAKLDTFEATNNENRFKIAATFCELGEHERAYVHMHEYNQLGQRDVPSMFYEAMAAYNTRRFKEALNLIADIRKIDEPAVIADYYLQIVKNTATDPSRFETLPYAYKLPAGEARRRIAYLNNCLRLDEVQFADLWHNDREFEQTLKWALRHGDENVQIAVSVMIAGFGDSRAEEMLRGFLLDRYQSDIVKNEIFVLLQHIGARGPFVAYMRGEIVEVHVESAMSPGKANPPLFDIIHAIVSDENFQIIEHSALELGAKINQSDTELYMYMTELAIAAVWIAATEAGISFNLTKAVTSRKADMDMVNYYIDALAIMH